jgi:predicted dehydrogenase
VLRWGILAPGTIADFFVSAVQTHTDQQVVAVASRSAERGARFGQRHGISRVHDSYERLLSDSDVDIVYVAAPHAQHRDLALLAIAAGKNVLIEKPIALSAIEAQEIADAASRAGVLAAEAMWTRYLPQFDVLHQILQRGDLGAVRLATADVGWQVSADAPPRFFDPGQGGGAALDMGVYGYWFAQFAIGPPTAIKAIGNLTSSGVDEQVVALLAGQNGRLASVTCTMAVTHSGLATIHGTDASARFLDPFVFPARLAVDVDGETHQWRDNSGLTMRDGLAWQAAALADVIAQGMTDSPIHALADAIGVMRVIDAVRAQLTPS